MASTNLPPFKYKDETLAAIGRQIGNLLGWMEQGDVMEKELEPVSQDGVDVIVSVDLVAYARGLFRRSGAFRFKRLPGTGSVYRPFGRSNTA